MAKVGEKIVAKHEVIRFMIDCMTKVGCTVDHATQLAKVLTAGDLRGHYSHGLNRLDMYVRDVKAETCRIKGEPVILKERTSTAWVNGNNLLGPVVGNFCMDLAITKAKQTGIGCVVAKGSNHFGIAGWYSIRAMENGCIGISLTNTSPLQYPTRGSQPALGTNPLSVAASATNGDNFVLDMATTTVAIGKVEIADRKKQQVPNTWGVANGGVECTDPNAILHGGGLLPLGGLEITGNHREFIKLIYSYDDPFTRVVKASVFGRKLFLSSGYKGYGLATMVELFCGILGDAHWGQNIRKWMDTGIEPDLGQCFVAIDPEAFAPGFSERLQSFITTLRNNPPVSTDKEMDSYLTVKKSVF